MGASATEDASFRWHDDVGGPSITESEKTFTRIRAE